MVRLTIEDVNKQFDAVYGHSVDREGFVFTLGQQHPAVFNRIIIRNPECVKNGSHYLYTDRTCKEHIKLVNLLHLQKAYIVCDNLDFILQMPSLNDIEISPSFGAQNGFDYSVLYKMLNIKSLNCRTVYGEYSQNKTTIDYSQINGIEEITIRGEVGHTGYNEIQTLKKIDIAENKKIKSFESISNSQNLLQVMVSNCGIHSLKGIENCYKLQDVGLCYNRSLEDVTELSSLSDSLRSLYIQNCTKIKDFSFLYDLKNLEYLSLYGSNILPDLKFIENMKNLKLFNFSMEVADGDLTPCLNVPYVNCEKGKKHYNLKNMDLPKIKPTEGFSII